MTSEKPSPHSAPSTQHSSQVTPVTGVILAGGLGRRMGGVDKGLQLLNGRPMAARVLARLAPQVDEVLINANQNLQRYALLGCRVVPDQIRGYAGPLAGLQSALSEARHDLVATVPCDSPFLPEDLVARLAAPLSDQSVDLAVAKTGTQPHPVFCLARRRVLPHLRAFLQSGGRKIDAWYATLKVVEVTFDDEAAAFSNINTAEELHSAENAQRLPGE
ncbi:MAG TPA: molybdenum cofactor guanylyltransferase MobA [Burkholderiales bacterium]|nr:molybdenum cofactor guanylyltransferase MobA [Burkholderiales bacterium]